MKHKRSSPLQYMVYGAICALIILSLGQMLDKKCAAMMSSTGTSATIQIGIEMGEEAGKVTGQQETVKMPEMIMLKPEVFLCPVNCPICREAAACQSGDTNQLCYVQFSRIFPNH